MKYPKYPTYTSDKNAWGDEYPAHWQLNRLRFACIINPSKSELADIPPSTEVSFVPMEAVGEYGGLQLDLTKPIEEVLQGYTYFRDGDAVLAKITPCFENVKGALAENLMAGIAFGTTELHVLRPRSGSVDPKFLFYISISAPFRKLGEGEMYGAGGQKRVPSSFVENFKQPFPPLKEQRILAAFLDRETAQIDTLIAKQERLIALLQEKRQALISHAVTKGLNPDAPMKDSGVEWLGEIPDSWKIVPFGYLLERIETGWTPNSEQRLAEDDEWAVLKVGCIRNGKFYQDEHKALAPSVEPDPTLEVHPGDLLMSRANTLELAGSVGLIETTRPRLTLSDKTFRLILKAALLPSYANQLLQSRVARNQIELSATGASQSMKNISQSSVRTLLLPIPPLAEQSSIIDHLQLETQKIELLIAKAERAIGLLQERRTALISAAVTGKIDVRAAMN